MTSLSHAIFETRTDLEQAIKELRARGLDDEAISIIGNNETLEADNIDGIDVDVADNAVTDVVGKAAAGAGIGALLGVAAMAIPGAGPLVAAGAIAEGAAGGAALTGTAVGAAAGGITGLLTDHGVDEENAAYYEEKINDGGIFVSVDKSKVESNDFSVDDILYRYNGVNATNQKHFA